MCTTRDFASHIGHDFSSGRRSFMAPSAAGHAGLRGSCSGCSNSRNLATGRAGRRSVELEPSRTMETPQFDTVVATGVLLLLLLYHTDLPALKIYIVLCGSHGRNVSGTRRFPLLDGHGRCFCAYARVFYSVTPVVLRVATRSQVGSTCPRASGNSSLLCCGHGSYGLN